MDLWGIIESCSNPDLFCIFHDDDDPEITMDIKWDYNILKELIEEYDHRPYNYTNGELEFILDTAYKYATANDELDEFFSVVFTLITEETVDEVFKYAKISLNLKFNDAAESVFLEIIFDYYSNRKYEPPNDFIELITRDVDPYTLYEKATLYDYNILQTECLLYLSRKKGYYDVNEICTTNYDEYVANQNHESVLKLCVEDAKKQRTLIETNKKLEKELKRANEHILQLQSLLGGEIYEAAKKEFYEFCEL